MKNISEIVEVNGNEYTLFLNRKGVVAWERDSKEAQEKLVKLQGKYSNLMNELEEKTDADDPFVGLDELDEIEEDKKIMTESFKSLYWIMLYTNHKMSRKDASEWYDNACKEYSEEKIIALANQMIEDANTDILSDSNNGELKNLKALRPTR